MLETRGEIKRKEEKMAGARNFTLRRRNGTGREEWVLKGRRKDEHAGTYGGTSLTADGRRLICLPYPAFLCFH